MGVRKVQKQQGRKGGRLCRRYFSGRDDCDESRRSLVLVFGNL